MREGKTEWERHIMGNTQNEKERKWVRKKENGKERECEICRMRNKNKENENKDNGKEGERKKDNENEREG